LIHNIEQVYYSYDFGDGVHEADSTEPNITHCYNETGSYNYSVNAIAVLVRLLSLHTNLTSNMELLGKLLQPPIKDIIFAKIAYKLNACIAVEGGGWWGFCVGQCRQMLHCCPRLVFYFTVGSVFISVIGNTQRSEKGF